MDLNNLFFFIFLGVFSLFFYKYFVLILNKFNLQILVDDEFKKPQAFHDHPVSISGGLGIFISFLILFLYFSVSKEVIYFEYLSFCAFFFIDLKVWPLGLTLGSIKKFGHLFDDFLTIVF